MTEDAATRCGFTIEWVWNWRLDTHHVRIVKRADGKRWVLHLLGKDYQKLAALPDAEFEAAVSAKLVCDDA